MNALTEQQHIHAIKVAILREEKSYNGVTLPSPQKSGTGFQQNTFAIQKATEIYENNFKNN